MSRQSIVYTESGDGIIVSETRSAQSALPGLLISETAVTYQYARPTSDISAGSWTASTGTDLYAMLDETVADDADYIVSPNSPTTQQVEVKFGSLDDPTSSTDHVVSVRLKAIGLDTNFDIDLVQATTILDSWTENVTVAAGAVTRTRTLSGAVADSITDYANLRLRVVARA